jgi:DNA-binding MarR family transcriptional regulator
MDTLVELSFSVQQVIGSVAARFELSVTQARLLGILRDREPAMGDLREHLGLEKSSVTGLVDRAERRGLVRRTSGRADGRAVHVGLTADGAALAGRFASEVYLELARMLAALPAADRRHLVRIADAVLKRETSPLHVDPTQSAGAGEQLSDARHNHKAKGSRKASSVSGGR